GGRVSLTVGLLGIAISVFLGSVVGVISGYYGGRLDDLLQRFSELPQSFPRCPLWMGLSAALPPGWASLKTYFAVVTLLSLIGWSPRARQIRGKVLVIREEEFIMAAKSLGMSNARVIFRHILPNTFSHIVVVATLSIPTMILAESSL